MKTIFSLCILLISLNSFSQQVTDLPNFTPPSPEAAAITQYGSQTINESSGKFTTSVPVYTYSAGKLQVPISLNYMGNGVKVNDLATWTGMNWTLNAGGVITRTVNHRADENATNRIFQDDIDDQNFSELINDTAFVDLYLNSTDDYYDSEPDIFHFSFGGYSGSFYLHDKDSNPNPDPDYDYEDYEPVLIDANAEIKISIQGDTTNTNKYNLKNQHQFKITTPDGVEYFFGGTEIEESFMDQDWHSALTPQAITSFYLTEIKHPINGHVFLEYLPGVHYKIATYENRVLKKYGPHPQITFTPVEIGACHSGSGGAGDEIYFAKEASPSMVNATRIFNNIRNGRFLSRIYSLNNSIEVIFNSSDTIDARFNFERVLNSIEVRNNVNTSSNLINEINLDYEYFYEGIYAQRFFLNKISFNSDLDGDGISNAQDYKVYEFEYNEPSNLPARFSSSQDGMGYYNGKSNLGGLLPDLDIDNLPEYLKKDFEMIAPTGSADRSTDFNYKSKGVLKKIIYPTKGHTLIEYESPYGKETKNRKVAVKTFLNNYPLPEGNGATQIDVPKAYTVLGNFLAIGDDDGGQDISLNMYNSETIVITVELQTTEQIGHQRTYLRITNLTDDVVEDLHPIVMKDQGTNASVFIETRTFNKYFYKNKDYKIELILPGSDPDVPVQTTIDPNTSMRGLLHFSYTTGYQLTEGEGLRVKRLSDFKNSNASAIANSIKRYYYTQAKDVYVDPLEAETTAEYVKPEYFKVVTLLVDTYSLHPVAGCNGWGLAPHAFLTEASPSRGYVFDIYPVNNFYKQSVLQDYKYVTISHGGDNFENGGSEKEFITRLGNNVDGESGLVTVDIGNKLMSQYSKSYLKLDHNKLDTESTFKKKGDTLKLINKVKYNYRGWTFNIQKVVLSSVFPDVYGGPTYKYENTWFGSYHIAVKDYSILDTKTTNYIDALPIAWPGNQNVLTNPYIFQGWKVQDHDYDGIINYNDEEYQILIDNWDPYEFIDESNYRKVITTTKYDYGDYAGQPTNITTSTSNDNKKYEVVNRYLDEIDSLTGLNANEIARYEDLKYAHRISSPVQSESYVTTSGIPTLLSTNRTLYSNSSGKVLPSEIQAAKGNNYLERRVEFVEYDSKGNPTKVKLTNGSITKYSYNGLNQVTSKIENYFSSALELDPDKPGTTDLCQAIKDSYPKSQVSFYFYDSITNLLEKIITPNCQMIFYEYDEQYRLEYVKDKEGNILSKNKYNYATQN